MENIIKQGYSRTSTFRGVTLHHSLANFAKYILLIFLLVINNVGFSESEQNLPNPFQPKLINKNNTLLAKKEAGKVYNRISEEKFSLHTALFQIHYASVPDLVTLLKDKENGILSSRGNLSIDASTNTILVKDTKKHLVKVRNLLKKLDKPIKQVLIEARIVNITRAAMQDLGIRFGVSKSKMDAKNTSLGNKFNIDFGDLLINPSSLGVALAKLGDGILLDLELSALESENKAEIIASPRLITTNQQTATIESGEEIPYQETSVNGTSVAFKKAVLRLKVTPRITPDNKLVMALHINQDSPSARDINGVPAILTKEIQTHVLINNGQTVVLGGIYKEDKKYSIKQIPFLGRLPGLGNLFRNKHKEIKNEELLIFITPWIITNLNWK